MGATVVYVHGNGNKVREDLLKQQWDTALFGKDMGASTRMAYWAPLRYPTPLPDPAFDELEMLPTSPLEAAPAAPVQAPEEFIAETLQEATAQEGLESVAPPGEHVDKAALESWLRGMTYAAEALIEGENVAPPPSSEFEALPLPRPARIAAFRALVRLTFKDVYAYFFGGLKDRMRQVVRDALQGIDGVVVVVGHSLGSIIAYDVLRDVDNPSLAIPLFITVGSPLAVTEVQDVVERPLEVPTGVVAWRNASDARDLVALDHTIKPEYAPPERCTDFLVLNESSNHHGIREYLRTVPVRQPILELFTA